MSDWRLDRMYAEYIGRPGLHSAEEAWNAGFAASQQENQRLRQALERTRDNDTARMDALESGIVILCDDDHIVHSDKCVLLYRNGTLMQLDHRTSTEIRWRKITWREAIDIALAQVPAVPGDAVEIAAEQTK